RAEVQRAKELTGPFAGAIRLHHGEGDTAGGPVAERPLLAFLQSLRPEVTALAPVGNQLVDARKGFDPRLRQERQVREMEAVTQHHLQRAAEVRDEFLWNRVVPT